MADAEISSMEVASSNSILGVNAITDSVTGVNESRLAPNIGLEEFWGLHTLERVRPIPAEAGLAGESQRGRYLTTE